jgi:DNA-binding transcriptional LysR family regulator
MPKEIVDWNSRIRRRLKLRDLHILDAVAERGSMAKAAAHLGMSQPSVSEAISNLEDTLRVRLLDRGPRGTHPTIFARALLKRWRVALDELHQGMRDIEFLAEPNRGEVRIGCPESLTAGLVPAIIERVTRRYPNIVVHVVPVSTVTSDLGELRERTVDVVLGRVSEPLPEEVQIEVLFVERYVVVVGARSPWARRRKVTLAELTNEPWVHMPANNLVSSLIADAFKKYGLPLPRESVTSYSMHLRNHLLATGRFLTIIPQSMMRFNAERWSLRALPIELGMQRSVAIITLKGRTLSPVVELFIDHIRAVARSTSLSPA